jgi:hypothetical protein
MEDGRGKAMLSHDQGFGCLVFALRLSGLIVTATNSDLGRHDDSH